MDGMEETVNIESPEAPVSMEGGEATPAPAPKGQEAHEAPDKVQARINALVAEKKEWQGKHTDTSCELELLKQQLQQLQWQQSQRQQSEPPRRTEPSRKDIDDWPESLRRHLEDPQAGPWLHGLSDLTNHRLTPMQKELATLQQAIQELKTERQTNADTEILASKYQEMEQRVQQELGNFPAHITPKHFNSIMKGIWREMQDVSDQLSKDPMFARSDRDYQLFRLEREYRKLYANELQLWGTLGGSKGVDKVAGARAAMSGVDLGGTGVAPDLDPLLEQMRSKKITADDALEIRTKAAIEGLRKTKQ